MRYSARLPDYYKSATPPDLALADIALLERVAAGEEFAVGLQNELAAHTQAGARPLTRVAVATHGGKIPLGELLPILEALGLTVMEEVPTRLDGGDDGAYLHDFGVLVDDAQLDCERDGERLAEAITAIWSGRVESDTLNALVVRAGLRHDDVVILRAYRRYRRIVAPTFTAAYQNDVLALASADRPRCSSSCSARASATSPTRRASRSCARNSTRSWQPWAASTRTASCAASPR